MKPSKVGGWRVHRDLYKGGNGGKIQVIGNSHFFVVSQVALLGVSDHCVKKPQPHPLSP